MSSNIFCKMTYLNRFFTPNKSYNACAQPCQVLSRSIVHQKDVEEKTTINEYHANKFTSEMNEWWNPNGPLRTLHSLNLLRIPFIRDGLVTTSKIERTLLPLCDKKILDVGCGGGILSEALAKIGADVTGIDANSNLLEVAQLHAEDNEKLPIKPTYMHTTIEDHAQEYREYYDSVIASEVIEHVNNKELFVKSCVAVLKPGGRIFFTTPNRTRICQVLGIWVAEYVLNLLPRGTHEYNMMITPTELTFLLEKNNCQVEASYGIFYHVLTNTFEFVTSQQLQYALQAVKLPDRQDDLPSRRLE